MQDAPYIKQIGNTIYYHYVDPKWEKDIIDCIFKLFKIHKEWEEKLITYESYYDYKEREETKWYLCFEVYHLLHKENIHLPLKSLHEEITITLYRIGLYGYGFPF